MMFKDPIRKTVELDIDDMVIEFRKEVSHI